jgi:glutamate/tyrosine decarboxylase-like PLP-dependent enzyme
MQDLEYMPDLSEMSPELTRHFRGLRLWLPLKLFGITPFQAALDEKLLLAEYFYREVIKIERMEVGPSPDLSIVIFRYEPEIGDANEFNQIM